jgi:hypothetical protein
MLLTKLYKPNRVIISRAFSITSKINTSSTLSQDEIVLIVDEDDIPQREATR